VTKLGNAGANSNERALKHLFGRELLKRISDSLSEVYPVFDRKHFQGLMPRLELLEMKPRVQFLRDELRRQLPQDYPKALKVLVKSVRSTKLNGFDLWPYTEFVQSYGLEHIDISLDALKEFTTLFTAEWAVRPFLVRYPKETLEYLERCALDKNVHVRRWASEGSRPRLPWGERLHSFVRDPSPTLAILEQLKFDPELFVRKSISNHLNDITKDHPDLVLKMLRTWQKLAGQEHSSKIDWIIRRSLRTLIKEGNSGALKLIGASKKAEIKLNDFKIHQKRIKVGERIDFEFEIRSLSPKPQKLVVDYIIHFVKSNKTKTPKVFKLKTLILPAREIAQFSKSHHLKKITTRAYYPGTHVLEVQINGKVAGKREWKLEV
jgi:3-methyladenine DNA glycosylase AlkC